MDAICPKCGAPVKAGATTCEYCGASVQAAPTTTATVNQQGQPTVIVVNQQPQQNPAINPAWPIKNKIVAALLAILLGSLGIHEFYLGRTGKGILMLVFFWTYIPGIIGLVQGIIMLTSNDENFQLKYHCRLQ